VYAYTKMPEGDASLPWHQRPGTLGLLILGAVLALNLLFW
jgi:hypothetical protein